MTAAVYHRKLKRMLDRMGGLYSLNDILTAIAEGRMQSFAEGDSWVVTQVMDFPRAKALEVFAAIGDLDDLRVLHDRIIAYAAEIGADVIQAHGQEGLATGRGAARLELKARYFIYQKAL